LLPRGARRAAGEWRNPEITADAGAKLVRDVPGGPDSNGVLWTVSALQTFEYPGRVRLRKAIANRQIALAELGLEGFKAALAAQVRAVIYRAALSKAKFSGTGEVSTRFDELSSVLSQRPAAGVAPQLDLRIIEANANALKRRALEAEREIQSARFALNQLRCARPDVTLDIPNVDLTLPSVPETATLLTTARRQNYDIRTHVMELEQQGFKVQLALNERRSAVQLGPFTRSAQTRMSITSVSARLCRCPCGIEMRETSKQRRRGRRKRKRSWCTVAKWNGRSPTPPSFIHRVVKKRRSRSLDLAGNARGRELPTAITEPERFLIATYTKRKAVSRFSRRLFAAQSAPLKLDNSLSSSPPRLNKR
jgi:hypothetical protein